MPDFAVNTLRKKIADGGVGVLANGPNTSEMCDYIGQFGFDAAFVDFEHGGVSWRELADITRACELWGMSTIVRVNKLDEAQILRTLDQGASGVVVPHIITPDDARHAAAACRYPPDGVRGVAGSRRSYGVDDFFRRANEEVTCTALIEDHAAVQNIEALIEVDGVDVFYVAPSDLAASMGHTGDVGHPDVQDAISGAINKDREGRPGCRYPGHRGKRGSLSRPRSSLHRNRLSGLDRKGRARVPGKGRGPLSPTRTRGLKKWYRLERQRQFFRPCA